MNVFDHLKKPHVEQPKTLTEMAAYLTGMSYGLSDPGAATNLRLTADFLRHAERNMCGQGYFGCHGGPACKSDHK